MKQKNERINQLEAENKKLRAKVEQLESRLDI